MISEQAKKKADELMGPAAHSFPSRALNVARVLQEHSDVAKAMAAAFRRESGHIIHEDSADAQRRLDCLILPDDEPDAGEAFEDAWHLMTGPKSEAKAKMAAAGFQIVRKDQ